MSAAHSFIVAAPHHQPPCHAIRRAASEDAPSRGPEAVVGGLAASASRVAQLECPLHQPVAGLQAPVPRANLEPNLECSVPNRALELLPACLPVLPPPHACPYAPPACLGDGS